MNLESLPKVELHCHLDGILSPAMTRDIRHANPDFPIDPDAFAHKAYPVHDFDSFIHWWDFIEPIKGQLDYFYPILARHIENLKTQNVHYAEIMIASGELPPDTNQAIHTLQKLREWVDQCEGGQIQVEFMAAFGRNRPAEQAAQIGDKILALYQAGLIVGVALAGIEQGNPVKPFAPVFARLHQAGMGIEIHAGEWCGPESVWDALQHGYPKRIGHGVSLFDDPRLIEIVREQGIHVEMCPTSNLKTGSIACIETHPIRQALELGLSFSVNTDDPGPFECSMNSEYQLLADIFGFGASDFEAIYQQSLAARFQPRLRVGATCRMPTKEDNRTVAPTTKRERKE